MSCAVHCALVLARPPEAVDRALRRFARELGLLFQIVDDILDGDGYVVTHGVDGARRLADDAAERARAKLADVAADTSVLREIVDSLAVRTV
jgi:geranylgeranyl diphosphate synthase type II